MGAIITALQRQLRLVGYMLARLYSERGQTMAEYAILIAFVAIAVVAVAVTFGGSVSGLFRNTSSHL